MATIIKGDPDPRIAALEQGVIRGTENFFQERERAKKEQKFQDAFRAISSATNYDDAVRAMGLVDREILANPQALALLSQHIEMRFPPQEGVQIEDEFGNISTQAVRKGDVAGALSVAQKSGGRLAQDTELERKRQFEDEDQASQLLGDEYKRVIGAEKLKLEERRTAAAERRARAAEMKAQRTGVTEKDKEIIRVSELLGGDTTRAMKIVYGLEETSIDPQTGEARVLDKATGRVAIIPAESLPDLDQIPGPKEGQALWDAALAGTGPFSALRAAAALPTAYMGVFEPKKTVAARQQLTLSTQRLVRALAANPRFAASELDRIRKEFSLGPSMWVHPETLRRRMVTVDSELRLWLAQSQRDSVDPRLPSDARAEAKKSISAIQNFISEMGIPEEHRNGTVMETSAEGVPPDVASKYPEVTFERWNRLSPEQKKRLRGM